MLCSQFSKMPTSKSVSFSMARQKEKYMAREQMKTLERGEDRKCISQRHFYDNMTREQMRIQENGKVNRQEEALSQRHSLENIIREQKASPQRERVIEVNKSALSAVSIQYELIRARLPMCKG
jgi:hypothetical protein